MSFAISKSAQVQVAASAGAQARVAAPVAEKAPARAADRLAFSAMVRNPAAGSRAVIANIGTPRPMSTGQKVTMALVVGSGAAAGFLLGRHLVARGVLLPYIGIAAPTLMGAITAAAGTTFIAGHLKK
jgi:hypothetical protein